MVYMGSKRKIVKYIKPIIEKYLKNKQCYIEPFCGGCNVASYINFPVKLCYDKNKSLIELLKWKQRVNKLPTLDYSKDSYNIYRKLNNSGVDNELTGYYGFLMSFNGRFFDGGYGVFDKKTGKNFFWQRLNNLNEQNLDDIRLEQSDFRELKYATNSVIYLDPPYLHTKKYKYDFDRQDLINMCKIWSKNNNVILLSEKERLCDNFIPIWEKEITHSVIGNLSHKATEKLFIWKEI